MKKLVVRILNLPNPRVAICVHNGLVLSIYAAVGYGMTELINFAWSGFGGLF